MKEMVMSQEEIQAVCVKLGEELTKELANEEKIPLFVGVMKGALNFFFSLIPHINRKIMTDYVETSSYEGTQSTGIVKITKDLNISPNDRTLVLVEDVIDTGLSMKYLLDYLKSKYQPKRIIICSLFDKLAARKENVHVDYAGKILNENKFLVGFGLDYNELDREIPYVYVPSKEDIKAMDELLAKE
ncbi:MAG TPA: hypoxanthine phosphoribosyltransferase [Firmicutes bacterium]|nr:hypoxanthine phosphoribosyltransferase [Bacillota bacterium]